MKAFFSLCICLFSSTLSAAVIDFEELNVYSAGDPAANTAYYNGSVSPQFPWGDAVTGGWSSGGLQFLNDYNANFDSWSGFSYGNVVDRTTSGYGNQYASFPGGGSGSGGVDVGGNYAIGYASGSFFNIPEAVQLLSIDVANTTYAALSMLNGDSFAKKFGGPSGNDPDLFTVSFVGRTEANGDGSVLGNVTAVLADYRFADNSLDYILDQWLTVDLSPLAGARSVELEFFSTDTGTFGINTPTYVALDSIAAVPEPTSLAMLTVLSAGAIWRRRIAKRKA